MKYKRYLQIETGSKIVLVITLIQATMLGVLEQSEGAFYTICVAIAAALVMLINEVNYERQHGPKRN